MREETIPVLAVRQPWASLIAEGHKTIEVRSRRTHKRGTIAIYASRTPYKQHEHARVSHMLHYDKILPSGQIIAIAELTNSFMFISDLTFQLTENEHHLTSKYYTEENTFGWKLENIKKIEPIEFKATSIIWSKIEKDKIKVI